MLTNNYSLQINGSLSLLQRKGGLRCTSVHRWEGKLTFTWSDSKSFHIKPLVRCCGNLHEFVGQNRGSNPGLGSMWWQEFHKYSCQPYLSLETWKTGSWGSCQSLSSVRLPCSAAVLCGYWPAIRYRCHLGFRVGYMSPLKFRFLFSKLNPL